MTRRFILYIKKILLNIINKNGLKWFEANPKYISEINCIKFYSMIYRFVLFKYRLMIICRLETLVYQELNTTHWFLVGFVALFHGWLLNY